MNMTKVDFEELELLGDGSNGSGWIVHKVKEKLSSRIMARKTIVTSARSMKGLLQELQTIHSNEHPNIVTFFGAHMDPQKCEINILTEFCEGGSLESVCERIKKYGAVVGEMVAARIAEGILQGLSYLHSLHMMHQHIQPSNILLSREGVVKLCDFGSSVELIGAIVHSGKSTLYMAPERIKGHEHSIRSDIWSMGISLLELVNNRCPFSIDSSLIEAAMHIVHDSRIIQG